jgi:hypothetical protein
MAGKTTTTILMLLALIALATGCSDDDPAAPVSVDTAPPALPTNFEAIYSEADGSVHLSWDANTVDTDLAGYLVDKHYNGETSALFASPISSPSCFDAAPGAGVTQYYVWAVDFAGNQSAVASATISVMGERTDDLPSID